MTSEELDALEALANAATPGPWDAGTAFCCPDMGWVDGPNRMVCPVLEPAKRTHTLDANDAEFIARAREAVPALIAALREARAEVEMLRGVGCMEDGDGPCGACRKCAFRRGVAAMREAAAQRCDDHDWVHAREIRALPDPEDK